MQIDYNTPIVVLRETCESLGILFNENWSIQYLSKKIKKKEIPIPISDLRIIARYINPHCKTWKKESLMKAFQFFNTFEVKNLKDNFTVGLQTPENIYSLNASLLYKVCKEYNIQTNRNSSIEWMENSIRMYQKMNNPYYLNEVKMKIHDEIKFYTSHSELVNILNVINKPVPQISLAHSHSANFIKKYVPPLRIKYTFEKYSKCADKISEERVPINNLEAIVMAALYKKNDISECEDPITEYSLMQKSPYFPNDKKLIERMREASIHPDTLLNPYLNQHFNPNLPENMYDRRDLIRLSSEEGFTNPDNDDSFYSFLQLSHLTATFIHGKQNFLDRETTFLEKISDLEYDQVVVFGVRVCDKKFKAYTYGELMDTFSSYKRFSDPITQEIFSDEAIEKLYLLTQKERRETESEEVYKERVELGEEIERVKIYIANKNEYVEEFLVKYENLDDKGKKLVETCLHGLLDCAMYMRNWDGVSDYPLTSSATNFENEKQIVVDDRVTQSLIHFEKCCKVSMLGNFILDLPLMQYHSESNTFVTCNDESEGLTIKERIRIVRDGENESMNSCIRLTSNRFLASSYFYMILLGFRIPFFISEVSEIF